MSRSFQDASTPSRPVVLGGSFIFSNSCDGYISPTLIEKYESLAGDLSSDKENLSNVEGCLDQSLTTEDVGANQDIISFTTAPTCVESAPAMAEKTTIPKKLDLVGPYISPHKKDIITFFLTDIGRQKTMEQDGVCYGTSVSIETVGETTPDCLTTEGNENKDESNKDIISFLTAETRVDPDNNRKLSYSLSVPKPKSRADLRKPYISLNFSDIISFYNSEESLLHACSMDSDQVPHDGLERQSEDDAVSQVPKSPDKENIPLNNPDQFVFQNDRSAAVSKISTSTPKPTLKRRKTPMMIHQGSVISFYSNEESFQSALEVSSVDGEDSEAEALAEEIDEAFNTNEDVCESKAAKLQETLNSDIKVFSNRTLEPPLKVPVRDPCKSESQLRKSNSVLVVTEEFPDIISFYNPGADDTADIIPAEAALEIEDSRRKIEDTAEFGMIELPQVNEGIVDIDNEVVTASDEEPFVMIDTPASEGEEQGEEEEVNPDKFVFRNDRSDRAEKDVSPSANQSAQNLEKKQSPMMIHQGSFITFYSNESSFLTALDSPNNVEPVESIEKDISSACTDVAVDKIGETLTSKNNFDIKVYANAVLTHDSPRDSATDCSNKPTPRADEGPSIAEETDKGDHPIEQGTANLEQDDVISVPVVVKEPGIEDDEPLVHIVEMNGLNRDSDYDEDMPGLEECPDSIHESDLSENQDSLVVVEDSISEDGKPIRKLQDIENLPSIERAIDMVNAIGGTMDENIGMSVPEPLEDDYMYDDDEFERDITEEIDSLISEAEQLMMPTDPADNDALCDDLDKFFDEVGDADELLLKAEPDEVPHLQIRKVSQNGDTEISPRDSSSESAIINFITQNIDKYMENTLETSVATAAPTNIVPSTKNADDPVAHIDELLDVEDYPDIPGCETPEPPSPLRDTPTPQPHTPTVTRHLIRTTSFGKYIAFNFLYFS